MTIGFSVKENFRDVQRQIDDLEEKIATRATSSAVNKTLDQGRTRMVREITAEFTISASQVRKSLTVKRASFRQGLFRIEGYLESPTKRGRSRNLIHFQARQTAKGVTVKVKRSGPRKLLPGAFIANRDNSAGGTVFIRRGKDRLPIEAKQTIDVAQMFNTKVLNERVREFIVRKFPEVFAHEVKFFTDKFNGRRAM